MAITQAMCTTFKVNLMKADEDFDTDAYYIALYTSSATLDASTSAYTVSNEASGTGYTAGGKPLTVTTAPTSGGTTTAYIDFDDVTWSAATITARGALIYNSSNSNAAVAVLDFGSDKTSTAGDFTIQFPAEGATTSIIRIA